MVTTPSKVLKIAVGKLVAAARNPPIRPLQWTADWLVRADVSPAMRRSYHCYGRQRSCNRRTRRRELPSREFFRCGGRAGVAPQPTDAAGEELGLHPSLRTLRMAA